MKKTIYIVGYILLFFCITSCKNKQQEEEISKHKAIINKVLGTQLKTPNYLPVYDYLNNYQSDTIKPLNSKFKIYSRINASCGTCVENINQWSVLSTKLAKYNTSIILVCHSKDEFEFIKYLCESDGIKNISFPLFFDEKNQLIKLNTFMQEHNHFETVLTDKDNYILAIGNPIISKNIENLYIKEIEKYLNLPK